MLEKILKNVNLNTILVELIDILNLKMRNQKIYVDIHKMNHWLNAKKMTIAIISRKNKLLSKKIKTKKNFYINIKEANFIKNQLSIPIEKIKYHERLPGFIHWSKERIHKTKRPIQRDNIHFYNYYSLPSPDGYIGPVILDILCPKNKMPKLNNGHLEQAITVNLGNNDIYGRWGKKKNKYNFSKIKFNSTNNNTWIIGDTYVEPTYCPHSYSRATSFNSQILSYTAKSPLEKFTKKMNRWPDLNFNNFFKEMKKKNINESILKFYLKNRAINLNYLSKIYNFKIKSLKQILNNKKLLKKVCNLLSIDNNLFNEKKFSEDKIGKTYMPFKESFKTIRNYKSYKIASMASSERYPDLFGIFIKVNKKRNVKDLIDYANCHYLVTNGEMKFYVDKKIINLNKGDALWISSFKKHGFSGSGSLIKISNGESFDSNDISEISKIFNPGYTIKRSYKDNISWGYD